MAQRQKRKRDITNPLSTAKFPMIMEQGKPKALIVDMESYREIELLVDNLINLREEDEDSILRDSGVLEKLIAKAKEEARSRSSSRWEDELDAL